MVSRNLKPYQKGDPEQEHAGYGKLRSYSTSRLTERRSISQWWQREAKGLFVGGTHNPESTESFGKKKELNDLCPQSNGLVDCWSKFKCQYNLPTCHTWRWPRWRGGRTQWTCKRRPQLCLWGWTHSESSAPLQRQDQGVWTSITAFNQWEGSFIPFFLHLKELLRRTLPFETL